MKEGRSGALFVAAAFGVTMLFSPRAGAEPSDAAALELDKKAIETDYLGTNFADAEKKLKEALKLCSKPKACSGPVIAQLHRDLGIIYIGGLNKRDQGKAEFVAALKADPQIKLNEDLKTPEMETAWSEATGGGASAGTPPGKPEETPNPEEKPSAGGDLVHTPPAEQAVNTPVPIYAELPVGVTATKIVLQYRPFGADTWKKQVMRRYKDGFAVEIPCADVGGVTGDLKYFLQAFDADDNVVAFSGTRASPIAVPIRIALEGDAPRLPDQEPPLKCMDTADCPPGLPGCEPNVKSCEEGGPCEDTPPASTSRKNWVSLTVQQDFLILTSQTNTCSGQEGNPYSCFNGTQYYAPIPYDKSGGELAGGFAAATTRILAGYDRAIGNFTVGLRAGWSFRGGPKAPDGAAFIPLHVEAKAAYWFGADPFGRKGIRPFVMLGGGFGQVDASVRVIIYETEQDFKADKRLTLDAWKKSGLAFVTVGGGAMFAIGENHGPIAELKFVQLLGSLGSALSGQVGYTFGF